MTMQDAWREYRDACYPNGLPAQQNIECHQAFFAGALCFYLETHQLSKDSSAAGLAKFQKLAQEVLEINEGRKHQLKSRN